TSSRTSWAACSSPTKAARRLSRDQPVFIRPIAALVPTGDYLAAVRQEPLSPLAGSDLALWGKDSTRTIRNCATHGVADFWRLVGTWPGRPRLALRSNHSPHPTES